MQRRFAIGLGGASKRVLIAQFAVIIDLAIRDKRGRAGKKRLITRGKINDGKPGMGQRDIA
jgi:hypothetical protein